MEGAPSQYSNPSGGDGRAVLERMNTHHVPLWTYCLSHLPSGMDGSVLDIGCGGGGFLSMLSSKYPYASLTGVDISSDALGMTAEVCSDLLGDGTLELLEASAESLPFADGSFDMVTAMETYFFWPDLGKGLAEAVRVLSAGGVLAVGSELRYGSGDDAYVDEKCAEHGMRIVGDDEMVSMMEALGLAVTVHVGEHGVLYKGVKGV